MNLVRLNECGITFKNKALSACQGKNITTIFITRSYYRKGSAASPPKSWGLIIPITNKLHLLKLSYTHCMYEFILFTVRNIEITICNNYYTYTIKCTSDFHIYMYACDCWYQCFKPSSLVKTSRRTQLGIYTICLLT